jgi:hypothetical protein
MRKALSVLVALTFLTTLLFTNSVTVVLAVDYSALAQYWAPEVYQDVNDTYGYPADYMTNFDFDGNWNGKDNWENTYYYPLKAYLYYWVQETDSHYFIGYAIFHTRDDGPLSVDAHENDLEGLVLAVKKDGTSYGQLQVMETMAHNQWYQYTNDLNVYGGLENIDGGILMNGSHPKVFCQSNGQSPIGSWRICI